EASNRHPRHHLKLFGHVLDFLESLGCHAACRHFYRLTLRLSQLSTATELTETALGTFDRKAFHIQKLFDQSDRLNVRAAIHALTGLGFLRRDQRKLSLPIAKNIRLHFEKIRDFADSEIHPLRNLNG